jgi:high-affinity K+ transport system ATPase subunit B
MSKRTIYIGPYVMGPALKEPGLDIQASLPEDECIFSAGQLIPNDGKVVEGVALVDESAITGQSNPLIREAGGDRSDVTRGMRIIAGSILVRMVPASRKSFLGRIGNFLRLFRPSSGTNGM